MTTKKDQVMLCRLEEYDAEKIQQIITRGMNGLGFCPAGNVFVKPNVVFAHNPEMFGKTAYTPPPFVEAAALAMAGAGQVRRVDIAENCAVGVPTRLCYRFAGYDKMLHRLKKQSKKPVGLFCMDEGLRDRVFAGGKVHDTVRLSRVMSRADTKVYLPKLKGHCVSKMTGAVKLNIGILSDDERSIRHDFLLNEKIVDLLAVGYPDFIVMDAIEVGVGNEAFPTPRKLGLVIMGTNPVAVDAVGSRLLGLAPRDVPYLAACLDRGYGPENMEDIELLGDITSLEELDRAAKDVGPHDDEFFRWQNVHKELERLKTPMRFFQGPYDQAGNLCETGCVMGLKMFLSAMEHFAGAKAFEAADPVVFVIGKPKEPVDAKGSEVFFLGSCAQAQVENAAKITRLDHCFTTAAEMNLAMGHRLGLPAITRDRNYMSSLLAGVAGASMRKALGGRYIQDAAHFMAKGLLKRL